MVSDATTFDRYANLTGTLESQFGLSPYNCPMLNLFRLLLSCDA